MTWLWMLKRLGMIGYIIAPWSLHFPAASSIDLKGSTGVIRLTYWNNNNNHNNG